jgi:hypothetical protein
MRLLTDGVNGTRRAENSDFPGITLIHLLGRTAWVAVPCVIAVTKQSATAQDLSENTPSATQSAGGLLTRLVGQREDAQFLNVAATGVKWGSFGA